MIKQQLTSKQDRTSLISKQTQPQPLKLSPSKSMTNYYKSPSHNNISKPQLKQTNSAHSDTSSSTVSTNLNSNRIPTKDSVIKKNEKNN